MAVSRRLRFEILRRDGHTCRYCGAQAPDVVLTVDHVVAVALGGGDDPTNLVTACQPCNAGKSSIAADSPLVADVDAAAMLWAKAIDRVNEARRMEFDGLQILLAQFDAIWVGWHYADGSPIERDEDWRTSVDRFLNHGLEMRELEYLVREAMTFQGARDPWRVFCSKAWRVIGDRQEDARRLIEDGEV